MPTPVEYTLAVRFALARDLPAMVKIEEETFGTWKMDEFETVCRMPKTVCFVALVRRGREDAYEENVVGFVVMDFRKYEVRVMNLAATWHAARRKLIEKANERGERHKLPVTWSDP